MKGNADGRTKYAIRRENYPDGTLRAELSYTYDGKQNGVTKTFYPNGTISAEMTYKDDKLLTAPRATFMKTAT